MRFAVLLAVITFALSLPSMAQFRTIAEAYEVRLSDLRLPQSEGGTVVYKTCDACAYESKLVSNDVQWILDGKPLASANGVTPYPWSLQRGKHTVYARLWKTGKRAIPLKTRTVHFLVK